MKLLINALTKFTCGLMLVGLLIFLPAGTLRFAYKKGYDEGYEQGMKDAPNGVVRAGMSVTLASLPIEVLDLSIRAFNALKRAGYNSIGDIVPLTHREMIHIKNLGPKQRGEVAAGLHHYGLTHTDWDLFYHEQKEGKE